MEQDNGRKDDRRKDEREENERREMEPSHLIALEIFAIRSSIDRLTKLKGWFPAKFFQETFQLEALARALTTLLHEEGRKMTMKLAERILAILPPSERRLLDILATSHPKSLPREELAEICGYPPSDPDFLDAVHSLNRKELMTEARDGTLLASSWLFPTPPPRTGSR